ncbi:MAG TPA: FkbM family methyltransferase [Thermoanaerobaculia bacterium]|nr:FkbM family methyltransferase [Thermoanaerobaculia bacterium]
MSAVLPAPLRRILPRRVLQSLRSLVWSLPNLDRNLRSGLRVHIGNASDWLVFNEIFVDGDYDAAIDGLIGRDEPLEILDLGANVGFFCLRVADVLIRREIDFRITAVEGSPRTFVELRRRLDQPLLENRLRLLQGLVGGRGGSASLAVRETHFTSSTRRSQAGDTVVEVPYVDLDDEPIWGAVPPAIDLLKCDIEGSEQLFLETYPQILERTRALVLEIHSLECDRDRCLELLTASGLERQELLDVNQVTGTSLHYCRRGEGQ